MSFDIENWPRREIYEFFGSMSQPFYSVTFRVDVTKVHSFAKAQGISFLLCAHMACDQGGEPCAGVHADDTPRRCRAA